MPERGWGPESTLDPCTVAPVRHSLRPRHRALGRHRIELADLDHVPP